MAKTETEVKALKEKTKQKAVKPKKPRPPRPDHKEYIKSVDNAKTAVLFIHGILSTPLFFNRLVDLVPDGVSIYNILLDGHGKEVDDFSSTSMKKWKEQVHGIIDGLTEKYENIILVGHSMGTLFCIDNAVNRPEKIKALFLISSPLRVLVHPVMAKHSIKVIFEKTDDDIPFEKAARLGYSITPDRRLWKYIPWAPRFIELLAEITKIRKLVPKITTPTYAFHSANDELVSVKSAQYFKNNKNIHSSVLKHSYHQYFVEEDYEKILKAFSSLFEH